MNATVLPLSERYASVRARTLELCEPLEPEDMVLQVMTEASPPKWHLGHTTWFFETFVLAPFRVGHTPHDSRWAPLFNSYYEAAGPRHPRDRRGDLSRPLVREIRAWRAVVDDALGELLSAPPAEHAAEIERRVVLGLHHEQQHQELLVMDVKAHFGANPLRPAYRATPLARSPSALELHWVDVPSGVREIGHDGRGFAFDNESPHHEVLVPPSQLASRCVTNAEWRAFVDDGGYRTPRWWLSDGWAWVQAHGIEAPRYWVRDGGAGWVEFTVAGLADLDPHRPVVHVSGYEAEAFAAWSGARLPTEFEWEVAACGLAPGGDGGFADDGELHPRAASAGPGLRQRFGDVWEWTRSAYLPYPGFQPLPGALGEYNGKFMSSQWVLRGGCCATPRDHVRATYRNFFYPQQRWPFAGVRLARDR